MSDTTPLTQTYNSWALVRDGAFITAENGRVWLFGDSIYAEQWKLLYPDAQIVRVEVTVRAV